jgi:hypothetical protein
MTMGSTNYTTTVTPTIISSLASGASRVVTTTVQIPSNASGGASASVIITGTSQGDTSKKASATLTTTANTVRNVTLTPATSSRTGNAGAVVTHTLRITNTGNAIDTFNLTPGGNAWTTTTPTPIGPLNAGVGANIVVSVTIPAGASGGANDVTTMTATSQNDGTKFATSTLTTTVLAFTRGLILAPASSAKVGASSQTIFYTLTITNTGSASDIFTIAVSGNTLTTTAPTTLGPLAAGASTQFIVSVRAPDVLLREVVDVATITATSQGDATKQATATIRTTVPIWGFLPVISK